MAGTKRPQRRSVNTAKRVSGSSGRPRPVPTAPVRQRPSSISSAQPRGATNKKSVKKASAPASSRTGIRWPQFVFLFLLLFVVTSVVLFAWDRWFRFDDAQDFQGLWTAEQTATPVTVDSEKIELSSEVNYSYKIDTWSKTISFTFGDLEGAGTYRFSPDRKKLVIIEGGTDDWLLFVKIALGISEPEEGAKGDGTTILIKQDISSVGGTP